MSDARSAAPPKGGYVYQELQFSEMEQCNYIAVQEYFEHPDFLILNVANRIAVLGDGPSRLKELRDQLDGMIKREVANTVYRLTS